MKRAYAVRTDKEEFVGIAVPDVQQNVVAVHDVIVDAVRIIQSINVIPVQGAVIFVQSSQRAEDRIGHREKPVVCILRAETGSVRAFISPMIRWREDNVRQRGWLREDRKRLAGVYGHAIGIDDSGDNRFGERDSRVRQDQSIEDVRKRSGRDLDGTSAVREHGNRICQDHPRV